MQICYSESFHAMSSCSYGSMVFKHVIPCHTKLVFIFKLSCQYMLLLLSVVYLWPFSCLILVSLGSVYSGKLRINSYGKCHYYIYTSFHNGSSCDSKIGELCCIEMCAPHWWWCDCQAKQLSVRLYVIQRHHSMPNTELSLVHIFVAYVLLYRLL